MIRGTQTIEMHQYQNPGMLTPAHLAHIEKSYSSQGSFLLGFHTSLGEGKRMSLSYSLHCTAAVSFTFGPQSSLLAHTNRKPLTETRNWGAQLSPPMIPTPLIINACHIMAVRIRGISLPERSTTYRHWSAMLFIGGWEGYHQERSIICILSCLAIPFYEQSTGAASR